MKASRLDDDAVKRVLLLLGKSFSTRARAEIAS
jgi:hypothetical protein